MREKAGKLANYKKQTSRVLVLGVDVTKESGMVNIDESHELSSALGFEAIYINLDPVDFVRLA